jgi:flavin-dependent dehydrogenase
MSADRHASSLEIRPLQIAAERYDVAILGGGLAGLTLSIQLKQQRPDTSVAVLEKREGPAPLAAFKVGESTVPSGAHYLAEVVGMRDHLKNEHLKKCGLRFFAPEGDNNDITRRAEVGTPVDPPYDNFQIDRGLFENALAARARSLGVDVLQGSRVREVDLDSGGHTVTFTQAEADTSTKARWVVDASGRASLLKRKLGLGTDCGHHINSSWFRLSGGLDIEDWGRDDEAWMGRMAQPGLRERSTNHLLGEGYWVWMIPLSTGPISIGVCADPRVHPFEQINDFDRMLDWLRKHEPQVAASVEPRLDDIEDFLRVEDFAYGVEQILSKDRWSLVGEAGAFADPFYSPGSDFIGYSNLFTGDLIARDLDGEDIDERLTYYNDLYQRTFEHVVSRYRDTYPIFGNPVVAAAVLAWDAYSGHNGVPFLCLQDKLTDFEFMKSADDDLDKLFRLNAAAHKLFREWHQLEQGPLPPAMLGTFPAMLESLAGLEKDYPGDDALREQLSGHVRVSEGMLVVMFHRAAKALPDGPSADRPINPYAVGLDPESWEADGLFDSPGMTLEEANEVVPGVEAVWAPARPPAEQPAH